MRRKRLISILFLCITLLFTACGNTNPHIIKIDDISYDLSGDFQDVIGEMVDDDLLVKDIQRTNVCYDENGKYSGFKSNIDRASLPACYVMERPHNIPEPGIIESIYYFRNEFETSHGIDEKSKKKDVKAVEEFTRFRGNRKLNNDAYIAMYMDNTPVDLESYDKEIREMLREFDVTESDDFNVMKELYFADKEAIPNVLNFELFLRELSRPDYMKNNNGKQFYADVQLCIALASQDAAKKLRDGKINSYSLVWYDFLEDSVEVYYYIYTYDENWDIKKFAPNK